MIEKILSIFCLFVYICETNQLSEPQPSLVNILPQLPTTSLPFSQRRSLNTNVENLLTIASKSGSQPTIVAIPLYIRNTLSSKYPSLLEILSSSLTQNAVKINKKYAETQTNGKFKPINDNSNHYEVKPNYTTQRFQNYPQKANQYNSRDEQTFVKQQQQREEPTHMSEANGGIEYSSPQKSRFNSHSSFTSASNSPSNQYLDSSDKMTFLRSPLPLRQERTGQEGQDRKQNVHDIDSGNTRYDVNKHKDIISYEQNDEKVAENADNGSVGAINGNTDTRREPIYSAKNYPSNSASIDNKDFYRNKGQEKSVNGFNSLQNHAESNDENMDFRFIESDDNYNNNNHKNDNKYYNNHYNQEYETSNKSPDFQSRSPVSYVRPYDRSSYSAPYTQPINAYTVRPVVSKPANFDTNYATQKPYISSSISPISDSYNNYNPSYHSLSTTSYTSDFQPITPLHNSQTMSTNTYNHNSSPNSYSNHNSNSDLNNYQNTYNLNTEPKTQYNSVIHPIYSTNSKDYSTQEEDCDEDNDYKTSHQTIKSQTKSDAYEMATKVSDGDAYETQDFDPTKLDLKIVHLPVSLLRRLISNGNIALPGYQ